MNHRKLFKEGYKQGYKKVLKEKTRGVTIKQGIAQVLKNMYLDKAIRVTDDEWLACGIFGGVCSYMQKNRIDPYNFSDIDLDADENGYTVSDQLADCFLRDFCPQLEISPGDFGSENFYEEASGRIWRG